METLIERKKAVLRKVYGGKRTAGMHNFRLSDGKCEMCGVFLGKAGILLCPIIGKDETETWDNGFGD